MNSLLIITAALLAVPPEKPITVGVANFAPMVVVDKSGVVRGADIDMFNTIANNVDWNWRRGTDYKYLIVNSFDALLSKVESGEIDIALAGISITHERLGRMDFSQPYENSGQRIMVPYAGEINLWSQIVAYLGQFFRLEILFAFVAFLINCFFWGVIIYFAESICSGRRVAPKGSTDLACLDDDKPNIQSIGDGTLAAFDAGTTIGYGRFFPVTLVGQFIGAAAFFSGAIVVGNVISTLTTDKIVHHFEGDISSPDDLKGKVVAVVNGTTSEAITRRYNPSKVVECEDFYEAAVQLRLGEVDAVVADDPVIRSYLKNNPNHGALAGLKFHPEDYGIAFAPNTDKDLIKMFSVAIAHMREEGELAAIKDKWYGE